MMPDVELLDLYWTSAGPADVHVGREWSTFDWSDRCAQAARVGFSGLGLWHADIEHQLETRTLQEMKRIFDDAGLTYLQVEFLADFFAEAGTPERKASDERRKLLFETAATFGAHHIKVGNIPGTPCELRRLTEEFAALCDDAANHTDATVVYEFMPFDVNVNTLDAALELVQGAGRANGGLAIDTWHMAKLGITPGDLRRIPAEYLSWVELSDGQYQDMEDRVARDRQPPPAARRGRVRHPRLRRGMPADRIRGTVGRRGALRGAAQPADRAAVRARLRDDPGAVSRGSRVREERCR